MEGCTETVLVSDVSDSLAGFEEGIDRCEGRRGGEDEFKLRGRGFGVELFQVDVDGGKRFDDSFEEREESLVVGGHSGPGVVGDCWDVFAFALVVDDGFQEDGFDFKSEGDVDVMFELELVHKVLKGSPRTSF